MVQYENQFKVLKDFLASHASNVEAIKKRMKDQPDETWRGLSEVRQVLLFYNHTHLVCTEVRL